MSNPKVDVKALAKLARLDVSDNELATLEKEIPAILAFVEIIQQAQAGSEEHTPELRNVMRDDSEPHESALYTDTLLASAPTVKNNQVVVKQVISRRK